MAKGLYDCTARSRCDGWKRWHWSGLRQGVAKMGGDVAIWARNEEKNAAAKAELLAAGARRVETYRVIVPRKRRSLPAMTA